MAKLAKLAKATRGCEECLRAHKERLEELQRIEGWAGALQALARPVGSEEIVAEFVTIADAIACAIGLKANFLSGEIEPHCWHHKDSWREVDQAIAAYAAERKVDSERTTS